MAASQEVQRILDGFKSALDQLIKGGGAELAAVAAELSALVPVWAARAGTGDKIAQEMLDDVAANLAFRLGRNAVKATAAMEAQMMGAVVVAIEILRKLVI